MRGNTSKALQHAPRDATQDSAGERAAALAPPAYGIDFVDRMAGEPAAVHAAAARGTRGAGGALPYLERIQSAFGKHDVSGVRAHTGAAATEASVAMGAEAFAFGNAVAFAGAPDLRVAAHEAAHVVQQRAGVHLSGGVGQAGDAYERHADAVADRVVRGESAEGLLDRVAADPASGAPAVQRSVGFEIELRSADWNIWNRPDEESESESEEEEEPDKTPPAKGTPIIHGLDFQLQAEYSGENLAVAELVNNPPGLQTRQQFEASVRDMQRLGGELNAVPAATSDLSAATFDGGDPDFVMDKKANAQIRDASMQVTAGVPLASVYALFKNLEGVVPEHERGEYKQARKRSDYVAGKSGRSKHNELKGLMVLLHQYLSQLNVDGPKGFVKGLIKVMARTDFHGMFMLLPPGDRRYIRDNMEVWITRMLSGKHKSLMRRAPMDPDERVVKPVIIDSAGSQDPAMRIDTTRRRWLRRLRHEDLLTYEGRETLTSDVTVFPERAPLQIQNEIDREGISDALLQEYGEALARQNTPQPYGAPGTPEDYYEDEDDAEAMEKAMRSLYMGLGSLGSKTDFIQYDSEPAEEDAPVDAEHYTAAPILEIRNPPLPQSVGEWFTIAERIYNAIDDAIAFPNGHGLFKTRRGFRNVLTPAQREMGEAAREDARALQERLQQAEEEVSDEESS